VPASVARRVQIGRGSTGILAVVAVAVSLVLGAAVGQPARAAGVNVNLDQWAPLDAAWQNGNLNGNNASYPEGGVIPFRLAIEGLKKGQHTITISYDFTAGGHKAFDFLASWNATNRPGLCSAGGGGVSSRCPTLGTPDLYPFPTDPFVANGISVAAAMAYDKPPRNLTMYGGTIVSISRPTHAGSVDGNSTGAMLVTFRSTGSAVLLAWGGHLAQSAFWDRSRGGQLDGAGQVSGAPWHMRTLNLDGAGARNQDRSIQPSAISGAILPPTPVPTARPAAPPATSRPPAANPPGSSGPPAAVNQPPGPTATLPQSTAAPSPIAPSGADPQALLLALGALSLGLLLSPAPRRRRR
jgi:hypothetical protein